MVLRYSRFYEFQRVGLSMSVFINCERFKFKIAEMMDIHICLAQKSPKLLRSWKKVKSVMILYGFLTLFRIKTCRRKKNFYINKIFCLISRKLLDVKKSNMFIFQLIANYFSCVTCRNLKGPEVQNLILNIPKLRNIWKIDIEEEKFRIIILTKFNLFFC